MRSLAALAMLETDVLVPGHGRCGAALCARR